MSRNDSILMHKLRTIWTGMVAAAVSLVFFLASNTLAADPPECSEMAEVFTTLRPWNNESSESYSCVSRAYSSVDGVTFFYSATSKKGKISWKNTISQSSTFPGKNAASGETSFVSWTSLQSF